ncbi:hypothetical protein ACFVHQ_19485 [Actinomycetes bacterium NPDC127524]
MLRTDELKNSIDYLEKAIYHYKNQEDEYWFKWLTISLHGALYGFGVCAVQGSSASLRVLENPSKKRINELLPLLTGRYFLSTDNSIPNDHLEVLADEHSLILIKRLAESHLNDIWTVLDKCENNDFMDQNTESKVLVRSDLQIKAINKLVEYRNDFSHFKPKSLTIITDGDKWMIQEVVKVIKFLALDSNNVSYYTDEAKERVLYLLDQFEV